MAIIERSVIINAPVEKVFAVEDDPKRLHEYMPGIVRMTDIVETPNHVGKSARFTYSVLGLRFPGKFSITQWEKNKRIVARLEGGVGGVLTNTYEAQGRGTKVTWRMDYTMKAGILGKAMNRLLVERMNEKNMERGLENLKMLCGAAF